MALLEPYGGSWTEAEAAHLARRAGFGARPDEIADLVALGMDAAVDQYVDFTPTDAPLEALLAALPDDDTDLGRIKNPSNLARFNGQWVYRMVHASQPLQEQLALFYHDTLVSEFDKVRNGVPGIIDNGNDGSQTGQRCTGGTVAPDNNNRTLKTLELLAGQLTLFRTDGPGPYRQMLRKIARNPAMLLYLDNYLNVKGKAQENFAREVMELFSMGIGNYSEEDVREVARAFTGETVDRSCESDWSHAHLFDATKHDTGTKIVFGQSFNLPGPGEDTDFVIDLFMSRMSGVGITPFHGTLPTTSIFIAWKFLTWFVQETMPYDDPAVGELAAFFSGMEVGGDAFSVRELLRVLFKSELFYDMQCRYKMFKNPADFIAMTLRNLEIDENSWSGTVYSYLRDMGMILYEPPNVAGWNQGEPWINSSNLIERYNYGNRLSGSGRMTDAYVDALLTDGTLIDGNDHAGMIEYFRARLIQDALTTGETGVLTTFLESIGNGANSTSRYRRKVRGLVHLFMAMPRYQLK